MKEVKERLNKYQGILPVGSCFSMTESERRAGDFLEAMGYVTNIRHDFGKEKIRLLSIQTATYAQELSKGTAKTVTENKTTAEASESYKKAREDLENIENDLSFLKAFADIFENAHVFYRQKAKGESF